MECEACLHSIIFKLVIIESFEYLITLHYPFLYSFPNSLHLPTQLFYILFQILFIFQPS